MLDYSIAEKFIPRVADSLGQEKERGERLRNYRLREGEYVLLIVYVDIMC